MAANDSDANMDSYTRWANLNGIPSAYVPGPNYQIPNAQHTTQIPVTMHR